MTWSKYAWERIDPIYQSIVAMPFITALIDGTLEKEKFQYYIVQDSIYLEHFGRALALIGARAKKIEDSLAFIRFADDAIVVENALHEFYFNDFGLTDKGNAGPACHHYMHFLKSTTALDAIEVGIASVLPCFWIYKQVGEYIIQQQSIPKNPYQKWIDTYGGEEFGNAVRRAINICDTVAHTTTEKVKMDMTEAFVTAARLEYEFWDAAYGLKKWEY